MTGAQLKALRLKHGLTQEQMADLAGLAHRQRWAEYETDYSKHPSRQTLELLLLRLDEHPQLELRRRNV